MKKEHRVYKKRGSGKLRRVCTVAALGVCCVILTVFSDTASAAVSRALSVCAERLLPSLFPYMVVSSLLVSSGAADAISRRLPAARLFGLPGEASSAVILGLLCGFPLGAKTAAELYERGTVGKKEAEALISVSNNTGPSFVVSVIGAAFWKNAAFGWWLYAAQSVFGIAAGIIVNRVIYKLPSVGNSYRTLRATGEKKSSSVFVDAVRGAVSASLSVCGFVMTFAVIIDYIKSVLGNRGIVCAAVASVLEITEGARLSAALAADGSRLGGFFCGFALGFSGLSVIFQAYSFCAPHSLSLRRTVAVKLLQGIFCGCAGYALTYFYTSPAVPAAAAPAPAAAPYVVCAAVMCAFFLKSVLKAYKM